MALPLVFVVAIVIFVVQFLLCFRIKHPWGKPLLVYLMGSYELLCVLGFFFGKVLEREEMLSFTAFILGYSGFYWAAAALLGWVANAIVKNVQKRRKLFVM